MQMSLFIRDKEVGDLARRLQSEINAPTLTEAVRIALRHEIARVREDWPMKRRVARAIALADALGPTDPNFNMKRFSDELSGDE
jgi:antitoxin VapB